MISTGKTVNAMPGQAHPIPATTLAEYLATSDVPGGVVNILTGAHVEVMPCLAEHADVNAPELTGIDCATIALDLETKPPAR